MAKKGKLSDIPKNGRDLRPIRKRMYKQYFLIVCEDQSTEPQYFMQFQMEFDKITQETMYLKPVGTGKDPLGVVEQAILERDNLATTANKEIDFVWVVFDKDDADKNDAKKQRFYGAFDLAKKEKIQVAYSNEVFELWLLLHLTQVSHAAPVPRQEIYLRLEDAVKKSAKRYKDFVYQHGKPDIVEIINIVGNEEQAILKSENLLTVQKNKPIIEANPSTKLHVLVKELRAWIKYYNQ